MENIKRESILRQFFNSLKEIFIDVEEVNNGIPTMTDLNYKDWEKISDAERKEILMKSPERIKEIVSGLLSKILPKKSKTSFASGTSVSKEQNVKNEQTQNLNREKTDDFIK